MASHLRSDNLPDRPHDDAASERQPQPSAPRPSASQSASFDRSRIPQMEEDASFAQRSASQPEARRDSRPAARPSDVGPAGRPSPSDAGPAARRPSSADAGPAARRPSSADAPTTSNGAVGLDSSNPRAGKGRRGSRRDGSRRPSAARSGADGSSGSGAPGAKKRNPSQLLSTVLIVVGVGLLLVAGGMWGFAQYRYWKQNQINSSLQKTAIVKEADAADPEKPYPEIDWEALKAVNDDVCSWIYIPDTVINYPIYQGVDNDQYLRTTATGEWSVGGQLFLDYESTNPGMIDHQSIIYGHHMLDGTLFQPLAEMEDQEKFDAVPTIWYLTETAAYELEPLMLYYTVPTDTEVRIFRFGSDAEFRTYLQGLLSRAVTSRPDAAEIIKGAKHVLTMSTCNYYDEWGRSILVAVPKAEAQAALDGTTAKQEAAAAAEAAKKQQEEQARQQSEAEEQQAEEETWEEEPVDEYYVEEEAYYPEDQYYYEGYEGEYYTE